MVATENSTRNGRLLDQHWLDLHASGLDDEQIARCGFHSVRVHESVQKILRWKRYAGELGACLAIPFIGADGKPTGYVRIKPDVPRVADGKPVKYESPKGASNLPYFPPGTLAALQDISRPLIITEGEKKAAKADQDGFACIGLVGVYGWQKKRARDSDGKPTGERELIDALAAVAWQDRQVYVCYDSDAATNPNVRRAECHLAEVLQRRGAAVKVVRLPQGGPGENGKPDKIGLDDLLVRQGAPALRKLILEAVDPAPPERGMAVIEAADDPHRLARLYLEQHCQHPDGLILRYWRDEWQRWDGAAYRVLPDGELRAELTAAVKVALDTVNLVAQKLSDGEHGPPTAHKVTSNLIGNVVHALKSMTLLPARIQAPAWLHADAPYPAGEVLPCRNLLVHLPALVAGQDHAMRPTPRFLSPTCLDLDFDLRAPAPAAWLDFLGQLWPDDQQSIDTLQEWFGYLLTPDTRQQKILMLVGPKRSGKGTVSRIVRGLVGADNVTCPTLAGLGTNFGLQPLIGKTVAMIQDARLSGRTDAAAVAERLLSISGEDAQTIDRKNMAHVTMKLSTRFMVMTNEIPKLADTSGALAGRMVILRLTRSWYGQEDVGLTDRLLAELPGILIWAIAGWQRLRERGRFIMPMTSQGMAAEMADLASPVGAFVRERCSLGAGFQVEKAVLYAAWKTWCEVQGRERPGDAATFGRNLRAVVPTIGESYPRVEGGRTYMYEGIRLI